MPYFHPSAMLEEAVSYLNCRPGLTYVDGTLGGAGHALQICERIQPYGRLIGIDQDEAAIDKRHNIYYDTGTGTTAAINFYKDLSAKQDGSPKIIDLDGRPGVQEVTAELVGKLG